MFNYFINASLLLKEGVWGRKRHNGSGTPEARPWSFASEYIGSLNFYN